MSAFTPEIYERIREGCQKSAAAVAPFVHELVRPKTVVDVGGGEGWWGRVFYESGCDVLVADDSAGGLEWRFEASGDGGPRIDFQPCFLTEKDWAGRIARERAAIARIHGGKETFDLALCLEVAEHVPAESADDLVAGLCSLAPVVLFSAAIPGQGGHGHLNERWPAYWADLFYAHGLVCTDYLRAEFWDSDEIEPWYRQNLLLFARYEWFDGLRQAVPAVDLAPFTAHPRALVHPDIYGWRVAERDELAAKLDQLNGGKTDG